MVSITPICTANVSFKSRIIYNDTLQDSIQAAKKDQDKDSKQFYQVLEAILNDGKDDTFEIKVTSFQEKHHDSLTRLGEIFINKNLIFSRRWSCCSPGVAAMHTILRYAKEQHLKTEEIEFLKSLTAERSSLAKKADEIQKRISEIDSQIPKLVSDGLDKILAEIIRSK